jgi:drug/metabolite transporter (DMT)-like permease
MLWLIAVASEIILETIIALRYRVTAQNNPHDAILATAIMYGVGVAPIGIAYAAIFSKGVFVLSASLVLWTVVASVLFAVANVMIYRAYSKMDASLYAIINSSKYLVIVLGAYILLSDKLQARQLVGVSIILAASIYISVVTRRNKSKSVAIRFIVLAFAASIIIGFAQISERVAVTIAPMATYVALGWTIQALLLLILAKPDIRRLSAFRKNGTVPNLITTGLLRGIAGICIVYAVADTHNASLVFSLAASKVVAIALAGYIFLHERSFASARLSAVVATFAGIILIVL